jgi:phosphoglucan,water dikinase
VAGDAAKAILDVQLASTPLCISLTEVTAQTGGGKADASKRLAELAQSAEAPFVVPLAVVIPFGVMEFALGQSPELAAEFARRLLGADDISPEKLPSLAEEIRELLLRITVPSEIGPAIAKAFRPDALLMVRSSANCEDLAKLSGAGLYDSIANVPPQDVSSAVRSVWASLWTTRAARSRAKSNIPHAKAHMAVLIQEMVTPEYAFVLHTVNPLNRNQQELYAELAVGLGETLVSAHSRGTPYRLVCHKDSGAVSTLAFANYSLSLQPAADGGLSERIVDYSRVELSLNTDRRQAVGRQLAAVGRTIEQAFGFPQDLEGVVVGERIFVVQSRAQQGLSRA